MSSENGKRRRMEIVPGGGARMGADDRLVKGPEYNGQFPYNGVGVLIIGGYQCTATMISHNVLLTAAHCVYDSETNQWIGGTNTAFYPRVATSAGVNTQNRYNVRHILVPQNYINHLGYSAVDDYAFLRTYTNINGVPIGYGYDDMNDHGPRYLQTVGYPVDLSGMTRIWEKCLFNNNDYGVFRSSNAGCDTWGGQSGAPLYGETGFVLGTWSGFAHSDGTVLATRMDPVEVGELRDYVNQS